MNGHDLLAWGVVLAALVEAALLLPRERRRFPHLTWVIVVALVYLAWQTAELALDPVPVSPRGADILRGVLGIELARIAASLSRLWYSRLTRRKTPDTGAGAPRQDRRDGDGGGPDGGH